MGADQQSIAIVPAVTFSAANAFKYLGSEILFCDIIPDTGILCLNHLEELLSTINPSEFSSLHCSGIPRRKYSATTRLKEISEKYQCVLIEDASHSFGASHWNQPLEKEQNLETVIALTQFVWVFIPLSISAAEKAGLFWLIPRIWLKKPKD